MIHGVNTLQNTCGLRVSGIQTSVTCDNEFSDRSPLSSLRNQGCWRLGNGVTYSNLCFTNLRVKKMFYPNLISKHYYQTGKLKWQPNTAKPGTPLIKCVFDAVTASWRLLLPPSICCFCSPSSCLPTERGGYSPQWTPLQAAELLPRSECTIHGITRATLLMRSGEHLRHAVIWWGLGA